jgi:threonine synthase
MKFYSTKNEQHVVNLRDAVLHSLAPEGGLYMPEQIPVLPDSFFEKASSLTFTQIAFEVARPFLTNDLTDPEIKQIVDSTVSFDAPLVKIEEDIFALELFHGPTLAFKDFGARFMSQLVTHFAKAQQKEITVLVATSGDTGSAVANGFYQAEGVRVIILYPSGKVSTLQEKQFTTLGKNITAIEIDGTFDDCQRLVKEAFLDEELHEKLFLTSANSINIARLIPQMFYYFYAWSRLKNKERVVFAVPSGNFGNLTAGLMAKRMGLPVDQFVAATNANDVVPQYLSEGLFTPRPSVSTISNAMDVGNPSNFARMQALYAGDWQKLCADVTGYRVSDDETKQAMRTVHQTHNYTLDPHGAVGYIGLKEFLKHNRDYNGVFLETAHPAKFLEVVEPVIDRKVSLPESLKKFLVKDKQTVKCEKDFSSLIKLVSQDWVW